MAKYKYENERKKFSSLIDVFENRFNQDEINKAKEKEAQYIELKGK